MFSGLRWGLVLVRWQVPPMFTPESLASPCLITENHAAPPRAQPLFSNYVIWRCCAHASGLKKNTNQNQYVCISLWPADENYKRGKNRDASLFHPIKAAINTLCGHWRVAFRCCSWKTTPHPGKQINSPRSLISGARLRDAKLSERIQLHTWRPCSDLCLW